MAVNVEGKVFCLDGRCTHAGAPLSEGTLNGEVLTCPWHYSQFNITNGIVLSGPAYKPLKSYLLRKEKIGFYRFIEGRIIFLVRALCGIRRRCFVRYVPLGFQSTRCSGRSILKAELPRFLQFWRRLRCVISPCIISISSGITPRMSLLEIIPSRLPL